MPSVASKINSHQVVAIVAEYQALDCHQAGRYTNLGRSPA
jgi:hypothetical protein